MIAEVVPIPVNARLGGFVAGDVPGGAPWGDETPPDAAVGGPAAVVGGAGGDWYTVRSTP